MGKWTLADMPSLSGKIAIVTGANSGLGLETSQGLAAAGATVVMACRNPAKAAGALAQVQRAAPDATVETMALDLSDLASIRAFADAFKAKYARLDLLVNNAGVMALPLGKTKDGFEMQIGTNHLGHFALTGLLLDRIKAAPGARVVNVASLAHRWTRSFDPDDLNFERTRYMKWDAYSKSKLANLLFTFELQRRFQQQKIDALAVAAHPGYSSTNLGFAGPALEKSALGKLIMQVGNATFAQPAALGALPQLYAAAAADVQGGDYIGPDGFQQIRGYPQKVGARKAARDPDTASRLWAKSEQLTGVNWL